METPNHETSRRSDTSGFFRTFLTCFLHSRGALPLLLVGGLLAFGIGCVVAIIPDILATRYAMYHGLEGDQSCDSYVIKPLGCVAGSEEAQSAAAFWNFVTKGLTFVFNPIMGSRSDQGRRPILITGLFLSCLPASVFLLLVMIPTLHPFWFNISNSLMGVVDMISIMFACLSDTIPTQFRAAGFGLLMSAFYGGFALAPSFMLFLNAQQLAVTSLGLISTSFLFALIFMPETVSEDGRRVSEEQRFQLRLERNNWINSCCYSLRRPLREMSILRQSLSLLLVTIVSFLSAMVFASDATLVLYYAQERLNVHPHDFATMFLLLGVVGILVQAAFLPPLLRVMGEHALLVASCLCGAVHNLMYGLARKKKSLYIAFVVSQFTKLSFPTLSSLASKHVFEYEQGRLQGALFATNAVAGALGPLAMEFIYNRTKDNLFPGFMFVFAASLYFVGALVATIIPFVSDGSRGIVSSDLQDPLLAEMPSDELLAQEPDECLQDEVLQRQTKDEIVCT
ncbi:hypothetical protein FisN_37Lh021 [Fistulifera solaris]|uniref:Major facilitator superfamily (MFS) profile domain-containing protein n=1 Tax=Fistulifera solaris TaxID=1519565 RepID=A0A1Z5K0D8_FISSO|nr:hypothetical protein FisN_37Lh021 [Fistulifera solaris]|eukprot:GAX19754.1 hypothetical protein FisN_37Lh021 [Fistulifera solaris]